MPSLRGKTVLITGASRGIGKAIALRCARDGANIVILAKTATPHPKLAGTIYTAAKEIEQAGGKALPCVCDIRDEAAIRAAVRKAVATFGGIDVCVNNASAISLTGTAATSAKRMDLMFQVNTRGTFLVTKACLPHLKKSGARGRNPMVLNISPPLNLNPKWFAMHTAYTIAKYGMSMCARGHAVEFKEFGIGVNTLWPRTAIATAAMKMLGGEEAFRVCRKVGIMSDAAHAVLTSDARTCTGKNFIDDEVLASRGVTNFDKYACVPGAKLMPDFFLDEEKTDEAMTRVMEHVGKDARHGGFRAVPVLKDMAARATPAMCRSIGGVFAFTLRNEGGEERTWCVDVKNGTGLHEGTGKVTPDCTMKMSDGDFVSMAKGKLNPQEAFFAGKLKITGKMALAMKLGKMIGKRSRM